MHQKRCKDCGGLHSSKECPPSKKKGPVKKMKDKKKEK